MNYFLTKNVTCQ